MLPTGPSEIVDGGTVVSKDSNIDSFRVRQVNPMPLVPRAGTGSAVFGIRSCSRSSRAGGWPSRVSRPLLSMVRLLEFETGFPASHQLCGGFCVRRCQSQSIARAVPPSCSQADPSVDPLSSTTTLDPTQRSLRTRQASVQVVNICCRQTWNPLSKENRSIFTRAASLRDSDSGPSVTHHGQSPGSCAHRVVWLCLASLRHEAGGAHSASAVRRNLQTRL